MTTSSTAQESPEKEAGFLSSEEQAIFSQIAAKEPPYSQRAQALLAVGEGVTQAEAGRQAGLTQGQVRYWLAKFRRDGIDIFPEELLNQAQMVTQTDTPDVQDFEQSQVAEEAQPELLDVEETAVQPVTKAKSKKKSNKKPKKKTKKTKKSKKAKKAKKNAKKNKPPKKAEAKKSKSGKKKGKSRK